MAANSEENETLVDSLLRMFLSATNKGEKVSLFLESRKMKTFATFKCSSQVGAPKETLQRKKSVKPSQLRRSQARMKKFIEKKEKDKQQQGTVKSAVSADLSQGLDGQLILQLDVGEPEVRDAQAAEIPQLDGEVAAVGEPEEVINLAFRFDHEKGRGNQETLKVKMRETMSSEVVKDIFVSHRDEKASAYGKKYNVFVTTLTIYKGKEKQVQWPRTVNGFLDVTLLGKL